MSEKIGDRIKRLRIESKLTQAGLASLLDVSNSTVGMYEQNRREPDAETLVKLALYFGVTTDYLLCKTNNEQGSLKGNEHAPQKIDKMFTKQEIDIITAYRAQPELQTAVKKLLGIEQNGQVPFYTAAYSQDNQTDEVTLIDKEIRDKLRNAPVTDEDLI